MRYYPHLVMIFFLFLTNGIEAQTDVSIRRKDFKAAKTGFKDAWKNIKEGDKFFDAKGIWYGNAFDDYLKAVAYNNSNAALNYKTGVSALLSDNKDEAAGFLLKAVEQKSDVTEDVLLFTGRALMYTGKFSEAIEKFNGYLSSIGKKSRENISATKRYIEQCSAALTVTRDTLRVEIKNLGANINSNTDDFSEVITADGKTMFFASRREVPKSSYYYPDSKFDENIYVASLNGGIWSAGILMDKEISTKYCETPLYVNPTADMLYIYAGYQNGGDIYLSVNKKGKWRTPQQVPQKINTGGSETSFCFTPAGNEAYYVTDKGKNNLGGKDIYFIKKISERRWSKPQNAGSLINTSYDEESVRFSAKGDTLFFSSKGHNTIGGFDIFFSVKNTAGVWDSARNFGYPVNTPWDELFYSQSPNENKKFYFVSTRGGGFGGLDIYQGTILPPPPVVETAPPPPPPPPPPPVKADTVVIRDTVVVVKEVVPVVPAPPPPPEIKPEPVKFTGVYLTGKVTDSETGAPIMAKIDVIDKKADTLIVTTASSDIDGSYRARLPAKKAYMIDLRATGFLSDKKPIDVPDNWPTELYNFNIDLIKVKVGKKVVLNNILFETGKSILTLSSSAELERLYNLLNENQEMKIEISGHTDKTGSEPINYKLSESRAKAVMDYLIKKGIPQSRMEYKGFGSLQPIADNATPQGRTKNRRVEFKILDF